MNFRHLTAHYKQRRPFLRLWQNFVPLFAGIFCFFLTSLNLVAQNIDASFFHPKIDFNAGDYPRAHVSTDVDGDGKIDIVAVYTHSTFFSVFVNNSTPGSIIMAPRLDFSFTENSMAIAAGNIDGIGRPDIVIPSYDDNTVTVIVNNSTAGSIDFSIGIVLTTAMNPSGVFLADIDGDGRTDIITVNNNSNSVSVLRNLTNGGVIAFAPKVDFLIGNGPQLGTSGDLNSDGKIDIVASNYNDNTVSILRNTSTVGSISFAPKVDLPTGIRPFGCTIEDMDMDGKPELMVTNVGSVSVSVFRNNSSGSNISLAPKIDFTTNGNPTWVAAGDINSDGKPELVLANFSGSTVSILQNNSNTSTIAFNPAVNFITGQYCRNVSIDDYDNDGKPDLATSNSISNSISILRGAQPVFSNVQICSGENFTLSASTTGSTYQWQVNSGSGFTDIGANVHYSGIHTNSLELINVPSTWNGLQFRCVVNGSVAGALVYTLNVTPAVTPAITITASSSGPVCPGTEVVFESHLSNGGSAPTLEWIRNGDVVGSGSSYSSNDFVDGEVIICKLTTAAICAIVPAVESNAITVRIVSGPNVSISPTTAQICEGSSQTFNTSGSSSYQWLHNNVPIPGANSPSLVASSAGEYSVLFESNGCYFPSSDVAELSLISAPTGTITPSTATICPNESTVLAANGGSNYQWYFNGIVIPSAINSNLEVNIPGTYSVVVSDNFCSSIADIQAIVNQGLTIKGMNYPTLRVAANLPFPFEGRIIGQNYSWSPSIGISDPFIRNPIITINQNKRYFITITDPLACPVTDTLDVEVYHKPAIYVPSGFTPNGDGRNDVLIPIPVHLKQIVSFKIFNRWGEIVFETKTSNHGWNGIYKGNLQPTGSYVWFFTGIDIEGKIVTEKGSVTLIR